MLEKRPIIFLPITGFEPRPLVLEATALPTEPQPLPPKFGPSFIYQFWEQQQNISQDTSDDKTQQSDR